MNIFINRWFCLGALVYFSASAGMYFAQSNLISFALHALCACVYGAVIGDLHLKEST